MEVTASVRGIVVGCLGEPIAGASVAVCRGALKLAATTSSAQGEFAVPCTDFGDAGDLDLVAEAPGKATIGVPLSARWKWWRLQLPDGARLTGRVFGDRQRPLAGALVCMAHDQRLGREESAVTDADGRFQFDCAPVGRVRLLAWRNGSQIERRLVDLRTDGECEIVLRPATGPSHVVRVHGLAAVSVSRAAVSFSVTEWTPEYPAWRFGGPLDERAVVELNGLPEGAGTDDPELRVDGTVVPCRWQPGVDPSIFDLHVDTPSTRDFEVVCVDAADQPLAAIEMDVRARPMGPAIRAVTDPAGRARVSMLAGGPESAYVRLVGPGWVLAGPRPPRRILDVIGKTACRVDLGLAGPARLTLQPAALVRGCCLDRDGRPHRHGDVVLSAQWTSPHGMLQSTAVGQEQLDASGRFEFTSFSAEADAELRVSLGVLRTVESSPFRASPGSIVELTPLVVPAFHEIRGVLRDVRGSPLPGRVLMAEAVGARCSRHAATDRFGRFLFEHVPEGQWRLVLSSLDGAEKAHGPVFPVAQGHSLERDLVCEGLEHPGS